MLPSFQDRQNLNKHRAKEEDRNMFLTLNLLRFGCGQQQKRHAAAPPPARVWRRMERNRQKLVGWDKGSLTEQQTKGTGTITIQKRGIHNTNLQNRARRT